jgi:hypothetical protein
MDLTTLSDDDLDTLRVDVTNEQERRATLATTLATVRALAARYAAAGGDSAEVVAAASEPDEDPDRTR